MKKASCLLLALICLCGCRLHDDYTGEPFLRLEYTAEGDHAVYEDWGLRMGNSFGSACSGGGLQLKDNANGGQACFILDIERLDLYLESRVPYFTEGRKYDYKSAENGQGSFFEGSFGTARITDGWFLFTRRSSQPYCPYELHFEFNGKDGQGLPFSIKDGCIQVGRRYRKDIGGLIKDSE